MNMATKKYVDDQVSSGTGAVEVVTAPAPPTSRARGSLVMTSQNQLYIYT